MWALIKWIAITLGLLIVGMVLFSVLFNWNWARGIVAHKVSDAIGRTVTIKGDLDVDWSWQPIIRVENIQVANADWSPEPYMLTLRHLVVQTDLRALLRGHVVLPMIELQEPVVRLESSATGSPNWLLLTPQGTETPTTPPTTLPTIGRVTLHTGSVSYHDYSTGTTFAGTLSEIRAQTTGPEQSVDVTGSGQFEHRPFQLTVYAGALPALQADDPYPVRGQFVLGEWSTQFAGTIARPLELAGVDMDVFLEGRHPAPAGPADTSASRQPGYHLTGHLTRQTDAWKIEELTGTLGKSRVAGQLVIDMKDQRPFLRADLTSDTLNMDDMTSILAGAPGAARKQEAGPDDTPSSALLNIEITRAVNGLLNFQGDKVIVAQQTLDNVSVEVRLQDGSLTLKPVVTLAGGTINGQLEIEAHEDALHSVIQAKVDRVNVQNVLAKFQQEHTATGIVNGRIDLAVSGRTVAELLASVAGKAALNMTDTSTDTEVTLQFATLDDSTKDAARVVHLEGGGRMRGQPVQLTGRLGSVHALHTGQQPYPVQVTVQLGETQAQLDGTIKHPREFTGLDAKVAFKGPDPATLAALLPVALPHLPAYQFEGRLLQTEKRWTLQPFKGALGKSDISGLLVLDLGGERPLLRGDLRSQHVRIDELTAAMAQNEARAAAQKKKPASEQGEARRAIPDIAFDLELLQRLDADLRFQGKDIRVSKLSLNDVSVTLRMENGHLTLTPAGKLDGGTMRSTLEAHGQKKQLAGSIRTEIKRVDLNTVLSKFGLKGEAFGKVDGHIDLTGQGRSLATWLASSDGDVSLTMAGGQLHGLIIELVGLDVAETIVAAFAGKDSRVSIRCLLADFMVSDGRMQTQMLVIDTSDTKMLGEGFIDLGEEGLYLKLIPEAKDFSLFSAEAPLYLKGPLTDLSVSPKIGEVLLSLAAPIKIGKPGNVNCQELFQAARKQQERSKP